TDDSVDERGFILCTVHTIHALPGQDAPASCDADEITTEARRHGGIWRGSGLSLEGLFEPSSVPPWFLWSGATAGRGQSRKQIACGERASSNKASLASPGGAARQASSPIRFRPVQHTLPESTASSSGPIRGANILPPSQ